jgi:hypothetical protein
MLCRLEKRPLASHDATTKNPVPLSSTQEQMWFIDQFAPGSASYNMAYAFQLTGTVNVAALERSFNEIVRRHESLRTTFAADDGVPVQVIAPSLTMTLPVITVSAGPMLQRGTKRSGWPVSTPESHSI